MKWVLVQIRAHLVMRRLGVGYAHGRISPSPKWIGAPCAPGGAPSRQREREREREERERERERERETNDRNLPRVSGGPGESREAKTIMTILPLSLSPSRRFQLKFQLFFHG